MRMKSVLWVVLILGTLGVAQGRPSISSNGGTSGNHITIENMLRRNRVRNQDLDQQVQHDMRVLSFFEDELNKIFSCYIRLSCPRTRSPAVISECEEIKDWPLYHQVMRMAGIRRYPFSNFAPRPPTTTTTATTTTPPPTDPTEVLSNGLLEIESGENNVRENEIDTSGRPSRTQRFRNERNQVIDFITE